MGLLVISSYSQFIIMLSIFWYLLLLWTFFPFTILSRTSFSRQFLLSQWPSHFLFLFLSIPALFFILPFFLAQLHFLFCLSILHSSSFSIPSSQMIPVVFAHSVVVSRSLRHTTLHSTQNTSVVSSVVLFPRVRRKLIYIYCIHTLLLLLFFKYSHTVCRSLIHYSWVSLQLTIFFISTGFHDLRIVICGFAKFSYGYSQLKVNSMVKNYHPEHTFGYVNSLNWFKIFRDKNEYVNLVLQKM